MRQRIPRYVLALLTLLLALALCWQCIHLYRTGVQAIAQADAVLQPIFTREAVAAHLSPLGPLFVLWLAALLAALVAAPGASPRPRPRKTPPIPAPPHCNALRIVLGIAGTALVLSGIRNGGMYDVLVKAINICTECIGLG